MAPKDKLLKANYVLKEDISKSDINNMYRIFVKYYENAEYEKFVSDLMKKDGANIVRRKDNNQIVGFSTVVKMEFEINKKNGKKKKAYALFSGDTIMEKDYWGSSALQVVTAKYALKQKVKYFSTPLYWFLISKGYKTYLLMANNLRDYWPRYDNQDNPEKDNMIKTLCLKFFPEYYDDAAGLLKFGNGSQKLKCDVAEITDEMKAKYPKIAYFDKKNPTWRQGTELPCAAEISVFNLGYGCLRQVYKLSTKALGIRKKKAIDANVERRVGNRDRRVGRKERRIAVNSTAFTVDRRLGEERRSGRYDRRLTLSPYRVALRFLLTILGIRNLFPGLQRVKDI